MSDPLLSAFRVRPFRGADTTKRSCLSIQPASPPSQLPQITVHQPKTSDIASFFSSILTRSLSAVSGEQQQQQQQQPQYDHRFHFDDIYHSECDQPEVFRDLVEPVLDRFFEGVHCTIICYGQVRESGGLTTIFDVDSSMIMMMMMMMAMTPDDDDADWKWQELHYGNE